MRDRQAKTESLRLQCEVRKICRACLFRILRCVTCSEKRYEVNHAMLFGGIFNDNSSAALGEKKVAHIAYSYMCTLKDFCYSFFEKICPPDDEKHIAKLVFIA